MTVGDSDEISKILQERNPEPYFPLLKSGCQCKLRFAVESDALLQYLMSSLQVRTLLYDYLTNEEQGSVSGRNPISSINEILRDGKFARDRTKVRIRSHIRMWDAHLFTSLSLFSVSQTQT